MGADLVPAIALYNAHRARRLRAAARAGSAGQPSREVSFTLVHLPVRKEVGLFKSLSDFRALIGTADLTERAKEVSWEEVLLALDAPGATEGTIFGLIQALGAKSPVTSLHCIRVAGYAAVLASAIDLSGHQVDHIQRCGLLHDIGKLGISETVLEKPGPLSDSEWGLIKDHPTIGVQTLQPCRGLDMVLPAVAMHHERFDGTGYPYSVAGYAIPLEARMVSICDAYDTMTSDRPYRKGTDPEEALQRLRSGAGTQFDPILVDAFSSQVFPKLKDGVWTGAADKDPT